MGCCLHHASRRGFVSAIRQASSLDSLVRVSRRAESSTARRGCQAPLPFLAGAKLGGGAAKHGGHRQNGAAPSAAEHTPNPDRPASDRHVRRRTGVERTSSISLYRRIRTQASQRNNATTQQRQAKTTPHTTQQQQRRRAPTNTSNNHPKPTHNTALPRCFCRSALFRGCVVGGGWSLRRAAGVVLCVCGLLCCAWPPALLGRFASRATHQFSALMKTAVALVSPGSWQGVAATKQGCHDGHSHLGMGARWPALG